MNVLVISRKKGESLCIDGGITIRVLEIKGECVRLGIDAPQSVRITRLPHAQGMARQNSSDKSLDNEKLKSDTSTR